MTTKRRESPGLDDLLKKAFADDLPADVASGMRDRADRFRRLRPGTTISEKPGAAWTPLFRRAAWAALALLMLVSGSLLQGLGSRGPLADRISLIETRQAVTGRLAAAESMSCAARIRNERGEFESFEFRWRAGESPAIRPDAASFSSPGALRDLLGGAWRPAGTAVESGRETGAFTTPAGTAGRRLVFTIDLRTFYPLRAALLADGSAAPAETGNILWEAGFAF